ncbi:MULTISPECIES: hypothetical protein [Enterobacter cloacae complex]|uniref:hypothetical protein n=1 Tax=Enterobacteriaceae TaxID=543 RepID=UPI00044EEC7F|nr:MULTISPECIES: hypothetical protein [Enterobacter cloacae complex]EUM64152.1 hypothetical protein L359_05780 [Enterobacter hormaechei subsp. hoffmannii MGH 13]EUM93360.1 hypothetical protein L350_07087 [Enterobacter sp. MGH 4]
MKQIPFEVLLHAESALNSSEEAMAVLSMWIDSIPNDAERHAEACKVSAVMSLLHDGIIELVKVRDAYKPNTGV